MVEEVQRDPHPSAITPYLEIPEFKMKTRKSYKEAMQDHIMGKGIE